MPDRLHRTPGGTAVRRDRHPVPGLIEDRDAALAPPPAPVGQRPTAGQLEDRASVVPAAAPRVEGNTLCGLIPFGVESRDLGGWRERLAPGCLTGTVMDDLVATVNHD